MRRGRENQGYSERLTALRRFGPDLRISYRPAACELPLHEAGHTKAPDHMREPKEKILAFHGASTHE